MRAHVNSAHLVCQVYSAHVLIVSLRSLRTNNLNTRMSGSPLGTVEYVL